MNIAILSRNSKLYSTRRLREAAKARGHRVRTLDALRFAISLEEEYPDLYELLDERDWLKQKIGY